MVGRFQYDGPETTSAHTEEASQPTQRTSPKLFPLLLFAYIENAFFYLVACLLKSKFEAAYETLF